MTPDLSPSASANASPVDAGKPMPTPATFVPTKMVASPVGDSATASLTTVYSVLLYTPTTVYTDANI